MADRFWNPAADHNWDAANSWAATDGGTPNQATPTSSDNVYFSNTNSYKCTITSEANCLNLDFTYGTGYTGELAGNQPLNVYSYLTYSSGMTDSHAGFLRLYSASTVSITNNGVTHVNYWEFPGGGTYNLQDDLTASFLGDANTKAGTILNTNDNDITAVNIDFESMDVSLGSSLVTITGTNGLGSLFNTLDAGTSTIKFTNTSNTAITFAGFNLTFYNVWFDRGGSTGNITVSWQNTFNDFKDTGTAAHSLRFTHGTTNHFTTFTVSGSAGKLITLNSDTTATYALVKDGGGTVTCDYLDIYHSVATPANTWYANLSTDHQATSTAGSGWTINASSGSTSPSVSPSVSPSPSLSPSISPSISPSVSPSPSLSPSLSPSTSPSPSASPSTSPSTSPSPSVSPSPSESPSTSPSTSPSPSESPSLSPSGSPSQSPSVSPSTSISPSLSPSQSPSLSPSLSPSVSPSLSPSQSPSTSPSPSLSPSSSPSTSPSPSLSPSSSPSTSPSPSLSPSISPSFSPSVSPSVSPSESPSPSPSPGPELFAVVTNNSSYDDTVTIDGDTQVIVSGGSHTWIYSLSSFDITFDTLAGYDVTQRLATPNDSECYIYNSLSVPGTVEMSISAMISPINRFFGTDY